MNNFIKKHKQTINDVIFFSLLVLFIFIVLNLNNLTFGKASSDFFHQHIRFIDYLRQSFFKTGDLIPQLTTNLGGGQSMSALIYYGYLNPLIILSYAFPFISTLYFMQILSYFLIVVSFIGMYLLLKQLRIKRDLNLVVSAMYAFAPPLILHLGTHPMFIYYFPILPISLIAINILVNEGKLWPFIISISLIFFFNFYFALVIGFVQIVYFIAYYFFFENKKRNKKDTSIILLKLAAGYIIGTLVAMIVFLPQALEIMAGARSKQVLENSFITLKYLKTISFSEYSSALGIIPLFTMFYVFLNRKNKFSLVIILLLSIAVFFSFSNILLNYFIYAHHKIYIYFVPLFLIAFAYSLNNNIHIKKIIVSLLLSSTCLVLLYLLTNESFRRPYFFTILIFLQIIIILYFNSKYVTHKLTNIFMIIISTISFLTSVLVISNPIFNEGILLSEYKKENFYNDKISDDFYRVNYKSINIVKGINEQDIKSYVSLPNRAWLDFSVDFIDNAKSHLDRYQQTSLYANYVFRNFFGLREFTNDTSKLDDSNLNVRPFIYGVSDKNASSFSSIEKIEKDQRMFALNQGFFVKNSKNDFKYNELNSKLVYQNNKETKYRNENVLNIELKKEFQQEGMFIIDIHTNTKKLPRSLEISVNDIVKSNIHKKSLYSLEDIRRAYILIDSSKDNKNLKIKFDGSNVTYDKIEVRFVKKVDLVQNNLDYIKTINNKTNYNKGYEFTLNLDTNGYLASSIFYDDGYIISDNGKIIEKEKVNGYFLGAKLSKGEHKIKIEYKMPGFNLGMIISAIGILILGFFMVKEIKFLNRPFFRFVLVGVFNTLNYYLAYSLLLGPLPYLLAHITSFIYSATCSYFLTAYYTFNVKPTLKTFIAFPLTFLPNLILSSLGTYIFVEFNILNKSVASLTMMILIIPVTFIINKFIFKNKNK